MYPIALMLWSPLSVPSLSASLPHVLVDIGVIRVPSSAKPDSGVRAVTVIFSVAIDTNSRFAVLARTQYVEYFLVAIGL